MQGPEIGLHPAIGGWGATLRFRIHRRLCPGGKEEVLGTHSNNYKQNATQDRGVIKKGEIFRPNENLTFIA